MENDKDVRDLISSKKCSRCGGEARGWKCPQCGFETAHFDAMHWRNCVRGGKMKVKCKTCGRAEDNCTCSSAGEKIS